MDFVVFSLGTFGDNIPFINLCKELQGKCKEVVFIGNEKFKFLCNSHNVDFISVSTLCRYEEIYANLSTWSATHSDRHYIDFHLPAIEKTFIEIDTIVKKGFNPTIIYQDPLSGAALAAEKHGLKRCKIALAPSTVYSELSPPFPLRAQIREKDWKEGMKIARKKLFQSSYLNIISPYINPIRKKIGLHEWLPVDLENIDSCDVYLGIFPDWLKSRPSDWRNSFITCGFPKIQHSKKDLSPVLLDFLKKNPKPIVATFGSGLPPSKGNINKLLRIGKTLNKGVIFITPKKPKEENHIDTDGFLLQREANYTQLFPLACIVIHHGGIGTCADCLYAGAPQLVTPFNFDQPDNAFLMYQLGVGNAIDFIGASSSDIAEEAKKIMLSKEVEKKCLEFKSQCITQNGIVKAACILI